MTNIPSKQTALEIASFGDPLKGCLRLNTDAPVPQPGKGQVLVKMKYSCLNPADVFTVMGVYPGVPAVAENKPGFVGGMEGMGVVAAQGEGASPKVGTRVVPLLPNAGAWQQYVVVDAARCVPVPDGVEDKAAAQLFVNPLTVIGMLDEVERHTAVKDNPWIVQTAANSTLGRMLIQAAKGRGLRTINVVRSAATRDELKKLGADEVIVLAEEKDVPKRVHHITGGKGAIAALDAVGGEVGTAVVASLAPKGLFLGYGLQSGQPTQVNNSDLIFKEITVRGFWVAKWIAHQQASVFQDVFKMMEQKHMHPQVEKEYTLDQYEEAFRAQFKPDRRGKILFHLDA